MKTIKTTLCRRRLTLWALCSTLFFSVLFIGCSSGDDTINDDPDDPIKETTFKASDFRFMM